MNIYAGIIFSVIIGALCMLIFYLKKINNILKEKNQKLELLKEGIPGGIFCYSADKEEEFQFISKELCCLFGYTEEEFRKVTDNKFSNMIYPADRSRVLKEIDEQIKFSNHDKVEYRIQTKDNKILWVDDRGHLISDPKGKKWFVVVVMDITDKRKASEMLALSERMYRLILEKSDNIICDWIFETDEAVFSDVFGKKFGQSPIIKNYYQEFTQRDIIHPEDRGDYKNLLNKIKNGHPYGEVICRLKNAEEEYLWQRVCFMSMNDMQDKPIRAFGIAIDIDKEMKQNTNLKELAERDSLTGLYNRRIIENLISEKLKGWIGVGVPAFIIIDLDNFKSINDTYGHMAGDLVLKSVAEQITKNIYHNAVTGRIGGDEFVAFINASDRNEVELVLNHIQDAISVGLKYKESVIYFTLSIGIAIAGKDGTRYTELYQAADKALYQAKERGRNNYYFSC